jgi:hypothetical protein
MKLKHITFTGVDSKTDIDRLLEIQREYPIVEFGILASKHWNENGPRYLNPSLIHKFYDKKLNLALHLCGSISRDAAEGLWVEVDNLIGRNLKIFKRIQLNIAKRNDNPNYCWASIFSGQEIIIQQKDTVNDSILKNTIEKWKEYEWNKCTLSVLIDGSGGQGIDTGIQLYPYDGCVGYAGGFNPENCAEKLTYLYENVSGDFWIDMESGVRTNDYFDLDKVVSVLETCKPIIEKYDGTKGQTILQR